MFFVFFADKKAKEELMIKNTSKGFVPKGKFVHNLLMNSVGEFHIIHTINKMTLIDGPEIPEAFKNSEFHAPT